MNTKHYVVIALASVSFLTVDAQNKKQEEKIKVKIYSNDNGKIINIDTTFADEKSADEFLKKNKLDVPKPPVPPLPPSLPDAIAPIPPLPPTAPGAPVPPMPPTEKKRSSKNKQHHIEIYSDMMTEKEMKELNEEMSKLKDELAKETEALKNFHFEFYNDDDNKGEKRNHVIIRDFSDGDFDTLMFLNFPDCEDMKKHMPCLDSMDFGYKYFIGEDDEGDKKSYRKTIIIKEKRDDTKGLKKKNKELDKAEEKKRPENLGKEKADANYKLEPQNFSLSPNPGDGKYNLRFSLYSNEPVTIRVIDLKGTEVFSETIKNFKGNYNDLLNIEGRLPGSYVLQIRQGSKLFTQKFVLK